MKMACKSTGIILFVLTCSSSVSQEMLGTTLGNYAGVNSIQLNPSALHNSKQWLDIHLVSGDLFVQNNFLYLDKREFGFWNMFKTGFELPLHEEDYKSSEVRSFYRYDNKRFKDIYMSMRLNGPGTMVIWGKHAFALTTAARAMVSMHNVPYDVANFIYLGLNYYPQQNINFQDIRKFSITGMGWLEAGLSYSYLAYDQGMDRISAGISVRKLFGIAGISLVSNDLDYLVYNDSTLGIKNMDATLAYALPIDDDSPDKAYQQKPFLHGGGWAFDLGVTYTRLTSPSQKIYGNRLCEPTYEDYQYRLGVALIDFGWVRFRGHSQRYAIENQSALFENLTDSAFSGLSLNQLMDTISYQFYGDPDAAYRGEKFNIWLPTALTIQFDYHYPGNFYVNASLIYGFPVGRNSLHTPTQLSVTPRYETRWFEANLPVSLIDWNLLRIGLSLRFYGLTIGTEKLGQFFRISNFTGMDLYFSLKIPLEKGICWRKGPDTCPAGPSHKKSGRR